MSMPQPHVVTEVSDCSVCVSPDGQQVTIVLTAIPGNNLLWFELPTEVAKRLASQLSGGMRNRTMPSAPQ